MNNIIELLDGAEAYIINGFDDCICGVVHMFGKQPIICYDRDAIIRRLCEDNDWDVEGAEEHFDFNIAGSYLGEGTPCFLQQAKAEKRK
jgi:hypothetical protein